MHQVTIIGGSPSNWETTEPTITAAGSSGALSASRQRRDGSHRISFERANRPVALLTSIATNGATAFLIIMAMTVGLTLPRMLFERAIPCPA